MCCGGQGWKRPGPGAACGQDGGEPGEVDGEVVPESGERRRFALLEPQMLPWWPRSQVTRILTKPHASALRADLPRGLDGQYK